MTDNPKSPLGLYLEHLLKATRTYFGLWVPHPDRKSGCRTLLGLVSVSHMVPREHRRPGDTFPRTGVSVGSVVILVYPCGSIYPVMAFVPLDRF